MMRTQAILRSSMLRNGFLDDAELHKCLQAAEQSLAIDMQLVLNAAVLLALLQQCSAFVAGSLQQSSQQHSSAVQYSSSSAASSSRRSVAGIARGLQRRCSVGECSVKWTYLLPNVFHHQIMFYIHACKWILPIPMTLTLASCYVRPCIRSFACED
jgi:hypothetical protein